MPEPLPSRPVDETRWADATGRAAEVAAAVLAHPGVVRLDGGPFGTVASHLPGRRRILGVRIGVRDEPVELAVVARLGIPLPQLAEDLGVAVRALLGPVAVEVTVSDVAPAAVLGGRSTGGAVLSPRLAGSPVDGPMQAHVCDPSSTVT